MTARLHPNAAARLNRKEDITWEDTRERGSPLGVHLEAGRAGEDAPLPVAAPTAAAADAAAAPADEEVILGPGPVLHGAMAAVIAALL